VLALVQRREPCAPPSVAYGDGSGGRGPPVDGDQGGGVVVSRQTPTHRRCRRVQRLVEARERQARRARVAHDAPRRAGDVAGRVADGQADDVRAFAQPEREPAARSATSSRAAVRGRAAMERKTDATTSKGTRARGRRAQRFAYVAARASPVCRQVDGGRHEATRATT